jgi:hypothetical protein
LGRVDMRQSSHRRMLVIPIFVAWLLAATASAAYADENDITNVGVVSATVDVEAGVAAVTFTVDCNVDVAFLRIRATLIQRHAFAMEVDATTCAAGETIQVTLEFGRQQGVFRPGPAALDGFFEVNPAAPGGDIDAFPVDQVRLHPG